MKYRITIDPFYYHLWVVEPDGLINFNDENRHHFSTEKEAIRFKEWIEKKKTSGEVAKKKGIRRLITPPEQKNETRKI